MATNTEVVEEHTEFEHQYLQQTTSLWYSIVLLPVQTRVGLFNI
jgi:hypothetical protein